MKSLFTLLLLLSNLTLFSQSNNVVGDYALTLTTNDNDVLEYKLALAPNGTFTLYYHSTIKRGIPPEAIKEGTGTWNVDNNVISFSSDKLKDLNEKYTLDFTNSKARFITKSLRDKTDKIVPTKLKFLESEIFWMKGIEMLKL